MRAMQVDSMSRVSSTSRSDQEQRVKDRTATRRDFFIKAGVAASAPATFALGTPANAGSDSSLPKRLAELEDENALRRLTAEFVGLVNAGSDVLNLMWPSVAEIVPGDFHLHASISVDTERLRAEVRLPCTVEVDVPIDAPHSVLLDMAQLQGEGLLRQHKTRTLRLSCMRADAGWSVLHAELEDAA
jgi:hypothetical protein